MPRKCGKGNTYLLRIELLQQLLQVVFFQFGPVVLVVVVVVVVLMILGFRPVGVFSFKTRGVFEVLWQLHNKESVHWRSRNDMAGLGQMHVM